MKNLSWMLSLALLLGIGTVGLAGGNHKCEASTQECLNALAAKYASKGWLGIETDKTADGRYAVTEVVYGSPAAAAGFRPGDVLVAINGADPYAEDKAAIKAVRAKLGPGVKAKYTVERAGSKTQLVAILAEVPREVLAKWVGEHLLEQHTAVRVAEN